MDKCDSEDWMVLFAQIVSLDEKLKAGELDGIEEASLTLYSDCQFFFESLDKSDSALVELVLREGTEAMKILACARDRAEELKKSAGEQASRLSYGMKSVNAYKKS